jgi:hypothetical protein
MEIVVVSSFAEPGMHVYENVVGFLKATVVSQRHTIGRREEGRSCASGTVPELYYRSTTQKLVIAARSARPSCHKTCKDNSSVLDCT